MTVAGASGLMTGKTTIEAILQKRGYRLKGIEKRNDGRVYRVWKRGKSELKVSGDDSKIVNNID